MIVVTPCSDDGLSIGSQDLRVVVRVHIDEPRSDDLPRDIEHPSSRFLDRPELDNAPVENTDVAIASTPPFR